VFAQYRKVCITPGLRPGDIYTVQLASGAWIANFATKDDWRQPSAIEWIADGCVSLAEQIEEHEIRSVAVPALGCGLGGLSLAQVQPLIKDMAERLPNTVVTLVLDR
jgi:O-acetyl-ADP-ribose deacetylase (regulator of RNase III)